MKDVYFKVHGYMFKELKLRPLEACVYALIKSYTDSGLGYYQGQEATADFFGVTRPSINTVFKLLVERGLVSKKEYYISNGSKRCEYRAI